MSGQGADMPALRSLTSTGLRRGRRWCLLAAVLCLAASGGSVAQTLPRELRQRILESVVLVAPYDMDADRFVGSSGSGTVIDPSDGILTNFHVIGDVGAPVEAAPVVATQTDPVPVEAQTQDSAVIGPLEPGQTATGALTGVEGASSFHTYFADVPPGTGRLTIRLTADVDLDLAAKHGAEITSYASVSDGGDWDHLDRSAEAGATFTIDDPEPGRWYVDVVNGRGPRVTGAYLLEIDVEPTAADATSTTSELAGAIRALEAGEDDRAFELFSTLAAGGHAEAQNDLGYLYEFGIGTASDDALAVHWYRLAARQGHAVAQTNLGYLIEHGRGSPQDLAEAARWYRLAAEQGEARAQTNLAWLTQRGLGVAQDFAEAARWYRLAADQGYARAQANLGYLCSEGLGVPQDDVEAVRWYRLGAEQGDAMALTNLGFMHEFGRGVPEDLAEAVRLYRLAAQQGVVLALTNLGFMYENGRGIGQDHDAAARCYRVAAERGYARAQGNLAHLLEHGLGVEQDLDEALRWYRSAAEQGYTPAQEALERLSGSH
jgi:TPR repeat protein